MNDGGIGGGLPGCFGFRLLHQEAFVLKQRPHQLGLVRADKRADPKHHFETHAVQFFHHLFGIRKPARVKIPQAVIFLPGVINHQDAGRETIGDDSAGVFEDILLVLIIIQFDPGVILGFRQQ